MSSWACSKCTYRNPSSERLRCCMCLTPNGSSSSSSSALPSSPPRSPGRWSCKACTFLNSIVDASCEVCSAGRFDASTRNPYMPFSFAGVAADLDEEELSDPSIGSVFFPLQRCGSKRSSASLSKLEQDCIHPEKSARMEIDGDGVVLLDESRSNTDSNPLRKGMIKILTYNVWFREDLELNARMKALGDLIQKHSPDFICFQEVTPNIYAIFRDAGWWEAYECSVSKEADIKSVYFCMQLSRIPVKSFTCKPFSKSVMGRELCLAEIQPEPLGKPMLIATSHLESPCPAPPKWDQMFSPERVSQAKEAVRVLEGSSARNTIFCGDMNWDDKLDGVFPLPDGWLDAWTELRAGEDGWTYDTKANPMLKGNRALRKRLDRFVCRLSDYRVQEIEMVGLEVIPGVSYTKEKKYKNDVKKLVLPVLPSDHFGLLLTISCI